MRTVRTSRMGFWLVARKTLIDLSEPKRVLASMLAGLLPPVLMFWGSRSVLQTHSFSVQMQTDYVLGILLSVCFVWASGCFLAFLVSVNAAGLISRDASEGTLLLLVSKPVSRREILFGRFAAVVVNAFLIEATVLVALALILRVMLPIETATFVALLASIPWILAYSLLVTVVFGAIAVCLSCVLESQIKVMAALAIIVVFAFGFGMVSHEVGVEDTLYRRSHLYLIDGAYQFGNAFVPTMERTTGGQILPVYMLQPTQAFSGVFEGGRDAGGLVWEGVIPNASFWQPAVPTGDMSPLGSICALLGTSAVGLAIADWRIRRKDIS